MTPTEAGRARHARHYPLDGLDLSFDRYHHRDLDAADVMASRQMDALLFPPRNPRRQWALIYDMPLFYFSQATHGGGFPCLLCLHHDPSPDAASTFPELLAVLRRHVFERSHPELRQWLRWQPRGHRSLLAPRPAPESTTVACCPTHRYALDTAAPLALAPGNFFATSTGRAWDDRDVVRLRDRYHRGAPPRRDSRLLSHGSVLQDARRGLPPDLWSYGPVAVPPPVPDITSVLPSAAADPCLFDLTCFDRERIMARPRLPYSTTLRTRRARSEPRPGAYMLTAVPDAHARRSAAGTVRDLMPKDMIGSPYKVAVVPLYVPCPPLSEVDHRTRRRSLSRRHVARMFHVPSREGGCLVDRAAAPASQRLGVGRTPRRVVRRCGWCGSDRHAADGCAMAREKRCKCRPFPVYHTAKDCPVSCSRPCVDPGRNGGRHAGPAMLCRARCCMCGIRGHSGRECRLKRCRCGEQHLGQDCGWKPQCRVRGCDRYLCGVHCRECGSTERPFVGWRCRACLANGEPVGEEAERRGERVKKRRRGVRKGKGKGVEKEASEKAVEIGKAKKSEAG